jgi:DNA-binding NtrC family response regulator
MTLSYETATTLFRDGDFIGLVRSSGRTYDEWRGLESRQRVLVANALARVGQMDAAQRLAELDRNSPSPPGIRSQAESAFCAIQRRRGNHIAALNHAQSAVFLAHESTDTDRTAWAQLDLFRLLIDIGPFDKALASLAEARRLVAKAANNEATAYFHMCVSVLEGQNGRLDEARRHCDIAEGLLKGSSNVWLLAGYWVNRGTIAWLNCDFKEASRLYRVGREMASRIGYVYLTQAVDISAAYTHLFMGEFDKAEQAFLAVCRDSEPNIASQLGSLDGLARLYLATDRLDKVEGVIDGIKERVSRAERAEFTYHVRWPVITEARLLINRGRQDDAIALLTAAQQRFASEGDIRLASAVHLTHAQAAALKGDRKETAKQLIRATDLNVMRIAELQGEYYYGSALTVSGNPALARQLRRRAISIWASQGVVSVRREIDNAFSIRTQFDDGTDAATSLNIVECLTNSLAALNDVAHRPRLLANEIASVIRALECSPEVKIVESRTVEPPQPTDTTCILSLGVDGRKNISVVCSYPDEPVKAILLADVFRMGRAALELERARKEERNRAAIWPANTAEEPAGALFIAEEMQTLLATARRIAGTTVPVLITGETGTGKEVLARTIHAHSNRTAATFLPFNCSSVPRDMLDSQLFGHRRGSFTGATENFLGVIRAANGGTLFLDEIGETTLEVQPKLLRFLDCNEVHPIGELQPVKADVRVIAATNVDLDAFVAQGRFREDLFYRLNIVRLHVPPLRERRVEIPTLANHYLQKHAQEYRKGDLRLAEETMEYLVLYRWPGNVRQLANEMRRMAALAETGAVLMPEHLSSDIAASRRTIPASERVLDPTEVVVRLDQPVPAAVQHLERTMIQYALRACGGKMEETATMLGLSRKGLYLKRLRYGLEPPEGASAAEVA